MPASAVSCQLSPDVEMRDMEDRQSTTIIHPLSLSTNLPPFRFHLVLCILSVKLCKPHREVELDWRLLDHRLPLSP